MSNTKTVIHPGSIVPVIPRDTVLEHTSVVIEGNKIAAILPRAEAQAIEDAEHIHLPDCALLPGLVNCHGHAAMSILRGYADDYPLMTWLQSHIWPAETEFVSEEFVADGVDLAMAELLLGGTTTFSDMYFFPDVAAQHADRAGMRAQMAFPMLDIPTAWAKDSEEYLKKGLELHAEFKNSDLVDIVFGPHSNYTVSEETLTKVTTFANELDIPIQIHLHETEGEVLMSVENIGERPIVQLERIGMMGPKTQCVHMTDLGEQDIDIVARNGAHIVTCPKSNMKLASGICPVPKLLERGINVALGTDGAASNNKLNMFNEMQTMALLAKLGSKDPTAVSAMQALEIATINGARALGYEDEIGSIEVGKYADLIAVNLAEPATQPVNHVISQLVYATSGAEILYSWVNGKCLLKNRELTTLDYSDIKARAAKWREKLLAFAAAQEDNA